MESNARSRDDVRGNALRVARRCIHDMVEGKLLGKYGEPLQQEGIAARVTKQAADEMGGGNKTYVLPVYSEIARLTRLPRNALMIETGETLAEGLLKYCGIACGREL